MVRQNQITLVPNNHKNIVRCAIALGSNLPTAWGDSQQTLVQALKALNNRKGLQLLAVSSIYQSPPLEYDGMPDDTQDYLNAVAIFETQLTPVEVLTALLEIEKAAGRSRDNQTHRWASRGLDLDLLLFNEQNVDLPNLKVPHPRMLQRDFVLQPLVEIAEDWLIDNEPVLLHNQRLAAKPLKSILSSQQFKYGMEQ